LSIIDTHKTFQNYIINNKAVEHTDHLMNKVKTDALLRLEIKFMTQTKLATKVE